MSASAAGVARLNQRVRTPTILQMEAVECGAVSLAIVMGTYGRFVSPEEVREACGVSRDGCKASNVVRAARAYGFRAKGFKREPAQLRELKLPFIVFWNFNHFVVVEGFGKGGVFINDPGTGPRWVADEEFDESFTGVVLAIEPGAEFRPGGRSPRMLDALRPRLEGAKGAITYLVLAGLALMLPGLLVPVFTQVFVDEYLVRRLDGWLQPLLVAMLVTTVFTGVLTWIKHYVLVRLRTAISVRMASQFCWHVLSLPMVFFTQRSPGEVSGRVGISKRVADLVGQIADALLSLLGAAFYGFLMIFYDPLLGLIGIATAGANVVFLRLAARRQVDASRRLVVNQGQWLGMSIDGLRSIETLKASGLEGEFFAKWAGYQAKVLNEQQSVGYGAIWLSAVPPLLAGLNSVAIIGLGSLRVMDGALTMGMLVAFQSLMANFLKPVQHLVGLGAEIQQLQGDMSRLDDVLSFRTDTILATPEAMQPLESGLGRAPRLRGTIELRCVSFGYSKLEPPLLENFSLRVQPGQRIGLVGPSGCGKSTVAKLISGLYEPWAGEILFDGIARARAPRVVMTHSVGMVDQDIFLFEGSVRDNLTFWDDSVPEADLVAAAKDAEIHEAITSRLGAYDAPVGEGGGNFSGGQRQRLEIARALARNPTILLLDEATSALDPVVEERINRNLRRRGCSCLIIAHRLSAVRDCDEILVLERGRIVQRGTHASLMHEGGIYATLMRNA